MKRIAWISSWDRVCGIADYSKVLVPEIRKAAASDFSLEIVSLDQFKTQADITGKIQKIAPDLIHIQHEYGLYGGKNPPLYIFPRLIKRMQEVAPNAKILATAHTVLTENYRFEIGGRQWQAPLRWVANQLALPFLRPHWLEKTWSRIDAGIVHSSLQVDTLKSAGCPKVREIPHFAPTANPSFVLRPEVGKKKILVFGFITPEKGQDIVVEALSYLSPEMTLTIAGGVRRKEDQRYYRQLLVKIETLGLRDRVEITGFVPSEKISAFYREADLVITPFRATSGSGSIAHGLSRGLPILASDLPLNRELDTRVPGCVSFFKSEDVRDCADQIRGLFSETHLRSELSKKALEYSQLYSPSATAKAHVDFYRELL